MRRRTQERAGAFPGYTWIEGRKLQWTNGRGRNISIRTADRLFYAGYRVGYHLHG